MKLKKWVDENKSIFSECDLRFVIKNIATGEKPPLIQEDKILKAAEIKRLEEIKRLYLRRLPLAYILGKEEFFGLSFGIDRRVLIPRKETELIVEKAIEIINKEKSKSVLDLCCGSANIAVAIAVAVKKPLQMYASDVSHEALVVAHKNIFAHKADVRLIASDLFSAFQPDAFDVVVANPPYVETHYIKGSLCFEPKLALDGGIDGLKLIRRIINEAHLYLRKRGRLVMECGFGHRDAIDKLIFSRNHYSIQEWIKDYSGIWRGVVLEKK